MNILYRKELAGLEGDELAARRLELQQEYEDTLANPYIAADRGYIDGVIAPSETRSYVARALRTLATKREAGPRAQAREHPAVSAAHPRIDRLVRMVRGEPDDVEVAALAVVLAALAAPPPPEPAGPPSRWVDRAAHLRRPLPVGPDAWRTSAWPG